MTPLQWALLIFGAVAVIAVYLYSRRDRRAMDSWNPSEPSEPLVPPVRERQLDIFAPAGQQFDEFGVGKPRRIAPALGEAADDAAQEDDAPAVDAPARAAAAPPQPAKPARPQSEKIVSLLIAEREGTHILGGQIHEALRAQGLEFGARQIYHRLLDDEPVFSVASLLKPGVLDPAAADSFSTPGLTMFMVLPGPQQPAVAIRDMLATADRLARALNAQVYDSKRKPLSQGAARNLQLEVETWADANP
ncbi:MAG: cell division protein ZipA C-terminal FtsZ-binding domain-containing protein [Nevskia sp.]|nr:cell division protein ZipA C-terminal FtsZ-binding domain-containing protein [Nevskia sp.]